jgi:DmsE family decaheme c-type cytochrome
MNGLRLASIPLALSVVWVATDRAQADRASDPAPAPFSVNDCRMCHEAPVTGMAGTPHAQLDMKCASCHGDAAGHMKSEVEKGELGPIVSIKSLSPDQVNQTCLTCHDRARQANWGGGVHERRGLSCVSCHSVHAFHSTQAQLKTARDAQTCFTCHTQIRAKGMRVSHHPVREGALNCASCHDPHDGTRPKMISAESVNEKCLSCHTEKRGPFLWEHAPVPESCLNCHDPHGSNHEKLLAAKQPYLCQRCHSTRATRARSTTAPTRRGDIVSSRRWSTRAELPPERPRRQRAVRTLWGGSR